MARQYKAISGFLAGRPWTAVTLLIVVLVLNQTDRLLPAVLAEPIKNDLGLSDTFLGIINGIGFLAVYAIAAIPISRVADKGHYGAVITAALVMWSGMTALAAFAATSVLLAVTRVGVAVGEAGCAPTAQAFVSRNFAPTQRAKALAFLTLGTVFGSTLGVFGGGLLGKAIGWRGTFLLMGVVGLLLAPLVFLALGPSQGGVRERVRVDSLGLMECLRKPTAIALFFATGALGMGGNASAAFSAAFLMRIHDLSLDAVAVQLGLISGIGGVVGLIGVSWLGARLSGHDQRWGLWLLAATLLVTAPLGFAAWTVDNPQLAVVLIVLSTLTGAFYIPLTVAALHGVVAPSMRAQASAVLLFSSSVAGGLGPLFVGMISDALVETHGSVALSRAMLVVPTTFLLAMLCYLVASLTMRRDTIVENDVDFRT